MIKATLKQNVFRIVNTISCRWLSKNINVDLNVRYQSAGFGMCGIATTYMVLDTVKLSFEQFNATFGKQKYLVSNVGWSHYALSKILKKNGQSAEIKKYFPSQKLLHYLHDKQKPIIASLLVPTPENLSSEGFYKKKNTHRFSEKHLVVVKGYQNSKVILHDPRDHLEHGKNLKISLELFNSIYTGAAITL